MKLTIGIAIAVAMMVSTMAFSADPVGPKLTPRLKGLIVDEMQHIAKAMADLSTAIATGDHHATMSLSTAVRDSFILKKSLTDHDKKDLMSAVPPEFIALDRRFHFLAGKLVHAAEGKDSELQSIYYAKMLESCVMCHTQFASNRFPGLAAHSGMSGNGAGRDH